MTIEPGTRVTFHHYGEEKTGTIERLSSDRMVVFLTDGRWLHIGSVTPDPTFASDLFSAAKQALEALRKDCCSDRQAAAAQALAAVLDDTPRHLQPCLFPHCECSMGSAERCTRPKA